MRDTFLAFLELMGVVSIVGFIAAMCVATAKAIEGLRAPWPKPMIMRGEFRSYVNRIRIR